MRQARDMSAQIILNGDTVDLDRSKDKAIRRDSSMAQEELSQSPTPPIIVLGNHDEKLKKADVHELIGPHDMRTEEIVIDDDANLAITHGHVFDAWKVRQRIDRIARFKDLPYERSQVLDHVCDGNILPRELKRLADSYRWLEAAELLLPLATDIGERVYNFMEDNRRWIKSIVAPLPKKLPKSKRKELVRMLDEYLTPGEYAASQLAAALGVGAIVTGHTHNPFVSNRYVWQHDDHGQHPSVLVGNSGSLVQTGKDMTWLLTETDWENRKQKLALYKYHQDRNDGVLVESVETEIPEKAVLRRQARSVTL